MLGSSAATGAAAVKAFNRIADVWQLRRSDRRKLLAVSERTIARWRDPSKAAPTRDQLERISYVLRSMPAWR